MMAPSDAGASRNTQQGGTVVNCLTYVTSLLAEASVGGGFKKRETFKKQLKCRMSSV